MRKTVWMLLLALAVVVAASAGADEPAKATPTLYVANLLTGGQAVAVDCGDASVNPTSGKVGECRLTDGAQVTVSIAGGEAVSLTITPERAFSLALPDGATLRGTTETITGLQPGSTDYFVYLWHVGGDR